MGVFVVFLAEPDEFVVEAALFARVAPRFIVARTATSFSPGVLNKASFSRGEFVGGKNCPMEVVVEVVLAFAGPAVCHDVIF